MSKIAKLAEEIDRKGMQGVLLSFPQQLRLPPIHSDVRELPRPRQIVVAGVGGSAIGGDIFRTYMARQSLCPVHVIRGYQLPRWVDSHTLVVAVSCSGRTRETLAMFQEARERETPLVAVTRGGDLEKAAVKAKIPVAKLQGTAPPQNHFGQHPLHPCGPSPSPGTTARGESPGRSPNPPFGHGSGVPSLPRRR